jgi:peptidoglycan/LPS O-acetylase OafA/YrhL
VASYTTPFLTNHVKKFLLLKGMSIPLQIPGITALRLFAALAVIMSHIELMKTMFVLPSLYCDLNNVYTAAPLEYIWQGKMHWSTPLISQLGFNSVVFFFVLSGFLITHVLINETKNTGTFSIRQFYWRRVVRIWPLYLMLIGFAFLAGAIDWSLFNYPNSIDWHEHKLFFVASHILFSPNVALLFIPSVGMLGHLWSIGVEEHFYLFWPLLLRKIKQHKNGVLIFGAFWMVSKIVVKLLVIRFHFPLQPLALYLILNKFECMALGGYLAFVFHDKSSLVNSFIFRHLKKLLLFNVVIFALSAYCLPEQWANFNYLFVASLSGLVIFKVSQSRENHWLNHNWIIQLGNASYAIYIVHFPIVLAVINVFFYNKPSHFFSGIQDLQLYSMVIFLSIILGMSLHRYLEVPLKSVLLSKH